MEKKFGPLPKIENVWEKKSGLPPRGVEFPPSKNFWLHPAKSTINKYISIETMIAQKINFTQFSELKICDIIKKFLYAKISTIYSKDVQEVIKVVEASIQECWEKSCRKFLQFFISKWRH